MVAHTSIAQLLINFILITVILRKNRSASVHIKLYNILRLTFSKFTSMSHLDLYYARNIKIFVSNKYNVSKS